MTGEGADRQPAGNDLERSQRRLQDLLRASTSVVERLDLEVVLRRIVEAGMNLVGARYGALGVISPDGGLERFIHVGIDAPTAERIGPSRGPRGARRGHHRARTHPSRRTWPRIRARRVSRATIPQMDSFLGVPVRVGDAGLRQPLPHRGRDGPFSAG